jgi:hypothetical protein
LRKRGTIEVIQEDLHERSPMQVGEAGNFADDADVAKFFDGVTVFAILIAD